jgi:hypothetical protein
VGIFSFVFNHRLVVLQSFQGGRIDFYNMSHPPRPFFFFAGSLVPPPAFGLGIAISTPPIYDRTGFISFYALKDPVSNNFHSPGELKYTLITVRYSPD